MKQKISVLIADDHPAVRAGLTAILTQAGFIVIGECGDGQTTVTEVLKLQPDVALIDTRMPKKDGLWALQQIRTKRPEQHVIMLSMFGDRHHIGQSVRFGVDEYLLKDAPIADVVAAIKRVHRKVPLPETSLMQPIKRVYGPRSKHSILTTREEQILRHVCFGASNKEIGERLGISVLTVRQLLARIFRKLDARDRTLAAVWAVKNGLM